VVRLCLALTDSKYPFVSLTVKLRSSLAIRAADHPRPLLHIYTGKGTPPVAILYLDHWMWDHSYLGWPLTAHTIHNTHTHT
jgi:hypothetical protein